MANIKISEHMSGGNGEIVESGFVYIVPQDNPYADYIRLPGEPVLISKGVLFLKANMSYLIALGLSVPDLLMDGSLEYSEHLIDASQLARFKDEIAMKRIRL